MKFQPSQAYTLPIKAAARKNPDDSGSCKPCETARLVYGVTALVAAPFAIALSYQRNKSIGWAILTSFVPIPYLVYRGVERVSE